MIRMLITIFLAVAMLSSRSQDSPAKAKDSAFRIIPLSDYRVVYYDSSFHYLGEHIQNRYWIIEDTMALINEMNKIIEVGYKREKKAWNLHDAARQCLLHLAFPDDGVKYTLFLKYLHKYKKLLNDPN